MTSKPKPQIDRVFDHAKQSPTKDYYSIYKDRDGTMRYYRCTMWHFRRLEATYGKVEGRWSYTNHQADSTY